MKKTIEFPLKLQEPDIFTSLKGIKTRSSYHNNTLKKVLANGTQASLEKSQYIQLSKNQIQIGGNFTTTSILPQINKQQVNFI